MNIESVDQKTGAGQRGEDPILSDARTVARFGIAIADIRTMLDTYHPLSVTAGTQFPLARTMVERFLAHASEIDPDMTVTEAHNLLCSGRR